MKGRKHHAKGGPVWYNAKDSHTAHEAEEGEAASEHNPTNDETAAETPAKAGFKPYKRGGKAHHAHHAKGGHVGHHKRGGKAHHAKGGHVVHHVHHAEGGMAHHHLGRKGRKTGGRVGADKSPLSSAHSATSAERD
jgi:hypothetical protein